jgi:hypothetical protein
MSVQRPASDSLAGASAQAEYERRRTREREHFRRTLRPGLLLAALLGVGAFGACAVLLPRFAVIDQGLALAIGAVAGLGSALWVATELWGRRQTTDAWSTGAEGERRTAELLAPLSGKGFVIFHDRRRPGSRGNLDHIVIGPTGVFVIDSKKYSAKVVIGRDTLTCRGRRLDKVVEGALRQRDALAQVVGDPGLIHPVLCFHQTELEKRHRFMRPVCRTVEVCGAKRLVAVISKRPQVLSSDEVAALALRINDRFPPSVAVERPVQADG